MLVLCLDALEMAFPDYARTKRATVAVRNEEERCNDLEPSYVGHTTYLWGGGACWRWMLGRVLQ